MLAEHVSGSVDAFVDEMNARAEELGMIRTMFTSPNGLDDTGYSSAADGRQFSTAATRALNDTVGISPADLGAYPT